MALTLEQILAEEERLKQDIAEKQALLSAYQLVRAQLAKGEPRSASLSEQTAAMATPLSHESAPAPASPPPAYAQSYLNPELLAIHHRHGNNGDIVAWAIQRMTEDYSVGDIAALLRREGSNLSSAEISGVLTRFKQQGKIEQVRQGRGRAGSTFRKPAALADADTSDQSSAALSAAESSASA